MNMIRYSTARLLYYKKQTFLYTLFSSFSAFLLLISFNLYNLQTTLHKQIQDRVLIFDAYDVKENLPSSETLQQAYLVVISCILALFALCFFFFFLLSLYRHRMEIINWRLAGLSKPKMFFFVFWQSLIPLVLSCLGVLLIVFAFQNGYQALLQKINLALLDFFELPNLPSVFSSGNGLSISIDQNSFFMIDFFSDNFLVDTLKGIGQTIICLVSISTLLSTCLFMISNRLLKRKKLIIDEPT